MQELYSHVAHIPVRTGIHVLLQMNATVPMWDKCCLLFMLKCNGFACLEGFIE